MFKHQTLKVYILHQRILLYLKLIIEIMNKIEEEIELHQIILQRYYKLKIVVLGPCPDQIQFLETASIFPEIKIPMVLLNFK